ncbi:class I SAM-dependent methyltransferase [Thermotoga sp.]|uniref:class I SAM-dependent methyltransferase n=1 Tax=Thermotoga sp. TaxID=28240 RepID=UPI0025CBCB2E|nr:class I SAM-dependent methyltransferase [Thermotoga sp.]MCD6550846.1 class I SAM-dependent methyltransferase [Thermotoga sp.]
MKRFVVTTSHKPSKDQVIQARELAEKLGTDYIPRRRLKEIEVDFYYVVEKSRLSIKWPGGEFFFHPSAAILRMRNIRNGQRDYLIETLQPEGNEVVLDTTFGLGSEAILMAAFLPKGKVIGLEGSVHIYTVVKYGMKHFETDIKWLKEALKRIELYHTDFKRYVKEQPDNSFDVVYCDPMFENPVYASSAMNPLRPFAVYGTVNEDDVKEMLRIARKKVILKSHIKDSLFKRISMDELKGSRKSGVMYGVIYKQ